MWSPFVALLAAFPAHAQEDAFTVQAHEVALTATPVQGQRVVLTLPAGNVRVESDHNADASLRVSIRCREADPKCIEVARQVKLTQEVRKGDLRLGVESAGLLKANRARIDYVARVPDGFALRVDVRAGDVEVHGVRGCTAIDMEAGRLDVELPRDLTREVRLDVGVGDAVLQVGEEWAPTKRSMLVGAESRWAEGQGECTHRIDLQFGNAKVRVR